jgi:ABC-type Fe3+-hydroxamate transport system substrate-binding protein
LADLQDAAAQLSAAAGEGMTAAVAAQALLMAATRPVENKRPTVVYLVSDVGMMVVGANNFIDDEIAAAGGENIGARCGTGYPIINREKLIELAPDILLIAAPGAAEQDGQADLRLAAWRALPIPAATKGRIYLMTDPDAEMLTLDVGSTMARLRALFAPASPMGAAETKP